VISESVFIFLSGFFFGFAEFSALRPNKTIAAQCMQAPYRKDTGSFIFKMTLG